MSEKVHLVIDEHRLLIKSVLL